VGHEHERGRVRAAEHARLTQSGAGRDLILRKIRVYRRFAGQIGASGPHALLPADTESSLACHVAGTGAGDRWSLLRRQISPVAGESLLPAIDCACLRRDRLALDLVTLEVITLEIVSLQVTRLLTELRVGQPLISLRDRPQIA